MVCTDHFRCNCIDPECGCDDRKPYKANAGVICSNCWGLIGGRTHMYVWDEPLLDDGKLTIRSGHMEPYLERWEVMTEAQYIVGKWLTITGFVLFAVAAPLIGYLQWQMAMVG